MAKKNLIIILMIFIIPLSIITIFIINNQLFQKDLLSNSSKFENKDNEIKNIKDYEIFILNEINLADFNKPLDFPLSDYKIFTYTIIWKDTLSKIAYKFKLTKDEITVLVYLNKIKNKNLIIAGQTLLITKRKE
jgi:LysM repeat protein